MDQLKDTAKLVQDGLEQGDTVIIGVLVAVLVVLFTILIFACRGGSNKRRGVLLMGVCDSGKTLIFNQLVNRKFVETYTSMKCNSGTYEAEDNSKKRLQIVDVPGHERVRGKVIDDFKSNARGIIYVIDSSTIQKEIKDVAEFLYTTLTDRSFANNAPPVLIACNKQDKMSVKSAKIIQGILEKEMNTVRKTKSAALLGTDDSANKALTLGKPGKEFSFSDVKPFKVDFVECNATDKDCNASIMQIQSWLSKIA